jgi:hypothetical protein
VAEAAGRKREGIPKSLFEELAMSVKSAAALVSTATAAVLLGLAPAPAQARPALPDDPGAVATASTAPPPGGVIDCTAGPAFRFARPCLIRSFPVRSPLIG